MNLIEKFNKSGKYTRYSFLVIILFSLIVLSLTSLYHVSGDGCWHTSVGKFIANNKRIPLFEPLGREEPFWSPPLYHLIVASVYSVAGNFGDFAVKFISPIFSILTLIFSFLTIKKLFSQKIAFYSVLFLSFVPIFLDYSIFSYVDGALTFFVVLSIYFLLNDRIILSGITAGLSVLTKYNGVFVLPVLIFILYKRQKNKSLFYKNAATVILLSLLIASPWIVRNWLLLGNPIWPFLNFAFKGYEAKSFSSLDVRTLADPNLYAFTYLGIFGVPDGNYHIFSNVSLPYFGFLFALWLIATLIFMVPLIIGVISVKNNSKSFKNYNVILIWVLSYLILFLLYAVNVGPSVSRMLLPAFPAIAVIWALGYVKLADESKLKAAIFLILFFVIVGFVLAESAKIKFAADSWNFYRDDFGWVRKNTGQDAIFIAEGQCIPYNIERTSIYATKDGINKADYIWVNQNFILDARSVLTNEKLSAIKSKNYEIAYENKKTKTLIYSARQ